MNKIDIFKDATKIKFRNLTYLRIIEKGYDSITKDPDEFANLSMLKEINDRLKIIELQLRLLFFGTMNGNKSLLDKLDKIDISKLPILNSIKKYLK